MPKLEPFEKLYAVQDPAKFLGLLQDNVQEFAESVIQQDILNNSFLQDQDLTAGSGNQLAHGLNRMPKAAIIGVPDANVTIWETTSSRTTEFIVINCSGSCTVSILVF